MIDHAYLAETKLLDYRNPALARLAASRGWLGLDSYHKIGAAYHFVKDEIAFGYNESDDIPASRVLADGYGQCNTKTTLLMALLRSLGVPCRTHAFFVDKKVQQGIVPELFYRLGPPKLLHSYTEVRSEGRWLSLEGCILDKDYLSAVQAKWSACEGGVCGWAVAVPDVRNPPVEWQGEDTFIQVDSIVEDLGVFPSPDELYRKHGVNLRPVLRFVYKHIVRTLMNRRVSRIRGGNRVFDKLEKQVSP